MIDTNTPIDGVIVQKKIEESVLKNFGKATIRELVRLVNNIEAETGQKYIRMEMGVPGLEPPPYGAYGEIQALNKGLASKYPMIEGVPELKHEISRFVKLFLDIEIDESCCLPTVGSTMGSFACFLMANRTNINKEGTLFIDPGFPVHKQQCKFLGQDYYSFDVYNFREEKLKEKLESSQKFVEENGKENLAQVYTDVRYKSVDSQFFSGKLMKMLVDQGFVFE